MGKPQFSEGFVIQEGLADYAGQPKDPSKKFIDSNAVKRVTALVCNSLPWAEVDAPTQLWIAPSSIGIRDTDAQQVVELIQGPEDIYSYVGYDIDSATRVTVGSASSGATIVMIRNGYNDDWTAEFEDPRGESKMYRGIFSHLGYSSLMDLTKQEICWEDIRPYDIPEEL